MHWSSVAHVVESKYAIKINWNILTVRKVRMSSALISLSDLFSTGTHWTSSRSAPIPAVSDPNHDFFTKLLEEEKLSK